MKAQGTSQPGRKIGYFYKLGLAAIATGIIIAVSSDRPGGILFAGLMKLLTLFGAPEDRDFLPPSEPEAGEDILQMLGMMTIACGAGIFSLRLLSEVLGFTGKLGWAARQRGTIKLGLGAAALGFLFYVSGALPALLLYEFFLYNYGAAGIMSTLNTVENVGSAIFYCGLALLILQRLEWLNALLGSWISRLGLGLIVIGTIGAVVGWGVPFIIAAVVGIVTLMVGVRRFLAAYRANP